MISLNITKSSGETIRYPFDLTEGSVCRIGRDASCEIALPEETYLSRVHCIITYSNGQLVIQDNRSSNGVFFREQRIVSDFMHLDEPYRLGECSLIAQQQEEEAAASAYPQPASYPQATAYPQQPAAYPQSYPQPSAYPQSYPQQPTAYPQSYPQPTAYPQSYQQPTAYPQATAYPQQQSYSQPTSYPQATAYPQSYPASSAYSSQAPAEDYSQSVQEDFPQPEYPQPTAEDFAMADAMEKSIPAAPAPQSYTAPEPTPAPAPEPAPAPMPEPPPAPAPEPKPAPMQMPPPAPAPEPKPAPMQTPPPAPAPEPKPAPMQTPPPAPAPESKPSAAPAPVKSAVVSAPIAPIKEKKAPINLKEAAAALAKSRTTLKDRLLQKGAGKVSSAIAKTKAQVSKLAKRKAAAAEAEAPAPEVVVQGAPGNIMSMPYDFDLQARVVAAAERFCEGVSLKFHIRTARDCRIFLISHEEGGRASLLLPGEKGMNTLAFSTVEACFPSPGRQAYDLVIEPPFGNDVIVVLALGSTDKCEFTAEINDYISKHQSKPLGELERGIISLLREKRSKMAKVPWSSATLHLNTSSSFSEGTDVPQGSFFHA